jgi:hypothetical protein
MKILLLAGAAAAALVAHGVSAAEPAQSLQVTVVPAQPLLERTLYGQAMNCDFRIANRGSEHSSLRVVNLAVRDPSGALIAKLELNDNGMRPVSRSCRAARSRRAAGSRSSIRFTRWRRSGR